MKTVNYMTESGIEAKNAVEMTEGEFLAIAYKKETPEFVLTENGAYYNSYTDKSETDLNARWRKEWIAFDPTTGLRIDVCYASEDGLYTMVLCKPSHDADVEAKAKDTYVVIINIVKRSEQMGVGAGDSMTRLMDIEFAHERFSLKLDAFLAANDVDFAHDFCGIQNCIDRGNKQWTDELFRPRFASALN
jgi:hypothetical protein